MMSGLGFGGVGELFFAFLVENSFGFGVSFGHSLLYYFIIPIPHSYRCTSIIDIRLRLSVLFLKSKIVSFAMEDILTGQLNAENVSLIRIQ